MKDLIVDYEDFKEVLANAQQAAHTKGEQEIGEALYRASEVFSQLYHARIKAEKDREYMEDKWEEALAGKKEALRIAEEALDILEREHKGELSDKEVKSFLGSRQALIEKMR